MDTGFLDAERLVESQAHDGIDLLGPTRLDDHWHAREGAGFDVQHFQIDGDQQHATGPAGKTRISWTPAIDHRTHAVIKVQGSRLEWRRGEHFSQCLRSKKRSPRRTLTVRLQLQYQALQTAG